MSYYTIRDSLDTKIVGVYPQADEALYSCDVWSEPKFIDRVRFQKVDFRPITAKAILKKKSKLTDLISAGNTGFSLKILVSGKLKSILENSRANGFQFYRSPVIYKSKEIEDYWVLNFYKIDMQFIDFSLSEIFLTERTFTKVEKLAINNYTDYLEKKKEVELKGYPYGIRIERFKLIENPDQDFFALLDVEGGVKYIVSEQLKKEIEEADCTGIEFMPTDLSLNEWLQGGEREKIYGKV